MANTSASEPALRPGTIVFSTIPIPNDGSIPGAGTDNLLAVTGSRGVVVRCSGHLDAEPDTDTEVLLVRFENVAGILGPPVGCHVDELALQAPPSVMDC